MTNLQKYEELKQDPKYDIDDGNDEPKQGAKFCLVNAWTRALELRRVVRRAPTPAYSTAPRLPGRFGAQNANLRKSNGKPEEEKTRDRGRIRKYRGLSEFDGECARVTARLKQLGLSGEEAEISKAELIAARLYTGPVRRGRSAPRAAHGAPSCI